MAEKWDEVKEAYAAANRALGNIVKVTPSSKVVGDLANFMVANSLDEHSLVEKASNLSFPTSVVEFMQVRQLCVHDAAMHGSSVLCWVTCYTTKAGV